MDAIAAIIRGSDAVVSAYAPPADDTDALVAVTERQIAAVKKAGWQVAGGWRRWSAGSGSGGDVDQIGGTCRRSISQLQHRMRRRWVCLRASGIDWTYVSPAAYFVPGERTGKFRLGTKELVSDAKGESKISFADYAIALADEIEKPAHRRGFVLGWVLRIFVAGAADIGCPFFAL